MFDKLKNTKLHNALLRSRYDTLANVQSPSFRARKDSRPANGTLTLRRASTTPFAQPSNQGDAPLPTPGADTQSMQQSLMYEQSTDTRYSRSQLLDIFKAQEEAGALQEDVSRLYVNGWNPEHSNSANGRSGWGKSTDGRDTYGPEICWDTNGQVRPVGLEEMSEQEKIVRIPATTLSTRTYAKPPSFSLVMLTPH
jgi:PERQ amino acid-rich with GYF domain-containing protein